MSSLYTYALKGHFEELRKQVNPEARLPTNIGQCIELVDDILPQTQGEVRSKLEALRVELLSISTSTESTATEPLKPMRKVGFKNSESKKASK